MRALLVPLVLLSLAQGSRPADVPFKIQPIDPGASETAAVADINRDGRLDIVSGEYWYQAPAGRGTGSGSWVSVTYIDNFSELPDDVDSDGYVDIVAVSWFAKRRVVVEESRSHGGDYDDDVDGGGIDAGSTSSSPRWPTWTTTAKRRRSSRRKTAPGKPGTKQGQGAGHARVRSHLRPRHWLR